MIRPLIAAGLLGILLLSCSALATPQPTPLSTSTPTLTPPPTPFGLYGVSLLNKTYCTMDGEPQKMDIYFPQTGGPWPVVFYIHGGSWMEGDKGEAAGLGSWLTPQGYVVVSVNYRLYPFARFPAMIEDIKCAVRFLRANAVEYNIDPNRIGAMGASAGGHLAALLGASDQSAGWDVVEYTEYSSRVQAVIDTAGPSDLTQRLDRGGLETIVVMAFGRPNLEIASPIAHVSPDDPPFLIIHGEKDAIVGLLHGQAMYDSLVEVGVPTQLVIVQNGGHDLKAPDGSPTTPTMEEINQTMLDFLEKYLK